MTFALRRQTGMIVDKTTIQTIEPANSFHASQH
jgi:hypothetical protein